MSKPVVAIQGLHFSYAKAALLKDINLSIYQEEFIAIIGPNASGKTTLLKLMMGLLRPDSGQIQVLGKQPIEAFSDVGYVPQYATFSKEFPITVREVVMLGAGSKASSAAAQEAMRVVSINAIAGQSIDTLSGGQMQCLLIARALAGRPKILILDEPTANIDIKTEENIFSLLRRYNAKMTIIVVSHDVAFISSYVDRVACLNKTLSCHNTESISGKMIEELYAVPVRMIDHQK